MTDSLHLEGVPFTSPQSPWKRLKFAAWVVFRPKRPYKADMDFGAEATSDLRAYFATENLVKVDEGEPNIDPDRAERLGFKPAPGAPRFEK